MSGPPASGQIRTHGAAVRRSTRPPGRRMLLVAAVLVIGALGVTYLAGDAANESERSAITSPDTPSTTVVAPDLIADEPVLDPLDRRVPGMEGTVVLTMGTSEGTEVWRWSTGVDGVLARSAPVADVYDARPAPDGAAVAAIRRFGHEQPTLQVGSRVPADSVFLGVAGFAWNESDPEAIVWLEQRTNRTVPTVHFGRWAGDGVFFKPLGSLPGHDVTSSEGIPDRLVAFDLHGMIIERRDGPTPTIDTFVERVALDGTPLGTVAGLYAGSSPSGLVAVTADGFSRVYTGAGLELVGRLGGRYDTVRWADDGRMAATAREGTTVDLIDGAATRTVEIGDIGPELLTWSADGRFVILAGHVGDEPVLVFIDTATLDTTTVLVSGSPIAAVSLP